MAHYAYNLAESLAALRPVTVVTAADYELSALPQSFAREGLFRPRPIRRDMPKAERIDAAAAHLRDLGRLVALVLRTHPSVVHLVWPASNHYAPFLLTMARALRGPATVVTAHEAVPYEGSEKRTRWYGRTYLATDGVIAHSRHVARELQLIHGPIRDIEVIPHGEYGFFRAHAERDQGSARARLGLPPDRRLLLFFGSIRAHKGVDLLASAWTRALDQGLPADVDLVVAGKARPESEAHVAALTKAAGSRLHGRIDYIDHNEVGDYVTASDALVLPYRRCDTSGILALAYAFGRPVVATDVGSLHYEVRPGVTGLLAHRDDPEDLGRQIVRIFTPGLLPALAAGALREAAKLAWPTIARQTDSFYLRLEALRGRA